ncbi:hypothetical protein DXG01_010545 [Tephrocybe rancida]|nr:hypothetical protein DXG01_010545 [Tephrocybe rancida]
MHAPIWHRKPQSASVDPTFGRSGRPWGKEEYLTEVVDDSLKTLNQIWEKDHPISLIRDEIDLRFSGNKVFHHGTQHGTVGDTFDLYMTGDMAHLYKPGVPQGKTSASLPQMHMELVINKVAFDKRARALQGTADDEIEITLTRKSTRKRGLSSSSQTQSILQTVPSKKARSRKDYSVLASRFVRSTLPNRKSSQDDYRKLLFVRADAGFIADTSDVEIAWRPDEESTTESGLISKSPMAKGATKTAHKFMINDETESFVAKRFFDVGSGSVDNATNSHLLGQELIQLKQGQWFLTLFLESVDEKGLDVCKDIKFSEGFLIKEQFDGFEAREDAPVWLVELRRTTSVVKFSGTLVHPKREDKAGKTITAFAHFVYEVSQKTMVATGSPMSAKGGRVITVLFDLMTHTSDTSSGVGDHGEDGIATFVEQHICDFFCRSLDLAPLQPDDGDSSET